MAFSVLTGTHKGSIDSNGITTSNIDTTGADLLIAVVVSLTGQTPTLSDNKSGVWTPRTAQSSVSAKVQIYDCIPTSVGSGHNFTAAGSAVYPTLCILSLSGARQVTPFDAQNGAHQDAGTTQATGSVSPSDDNELIIAALGAGATAASIDSSFTLSQSEPFNGAGSGTFAGGLAYLIQTAKGAVNPTWTIGSSMYSAVAIATYRIPSVVAGRMFSVF